MEKNRLSTLNVLHAGIVYTALLAIPYHIAMRLCTVHPHWTLSVMVHAFVSELHAELTINVLTRRYLFVVITGVVQFNVTVSEIGLYL